MQVSHNDPIETLVTHGSALVAPPQRQPQRGGVPDRADDGVNQDGAQVGEEELVGHAVAGVQHDRRQQVKEEDDRGELEGLDLVRAPDYPA